MGLPQRLMRYWAQRRNHFTDVVLFDFSKEGMEAAAGPKKDNFGDPKLWVAWYDGFWGGGSSASWDWSEEDGGKAVFSGEFSRKETPNLGKSGFVAAQAKLPWHLANVSGFDAVEIKFRPDHHRYMFNIQPHTFIPDDLYQGFLIAPKDIKEGEWLTGVLPFRQFVLTGHGQVKEEQREFDHDLIKSVGFSLFGEQVEEGPFRLEIKQINLLCEQTLTNEYNIQNSRW